MQTQLQHIQFNVRPENISFYRDLFGFLGWNTVYEDEGILGVGDANDLSLWFSGRVKDVANDYDGPGVNHLGIHTVAQADVDSAADFLRGRGVEMLFGTPRHNEEYSSEESTYYQIRFTSPDNILREVVSSGPKQ